MADKTCTYIWIVGSPRSGTTFLTRLIGENCDLTYDEPGDIPHLQRGKVEDWHFPEATSVCFKWCENYRVADKIIEKFPNSYFIHITREPNNNIYSIAFPKESAFPPRQFSELGNDLEDRIVKAIRVWFEYDRGCRQLRKQFGSRYLQVNYENLPDYYPAIEALTGIELKTRREFSCQNLPEKALADIETYWKQTPGAARYAAQVTGLPLKPGFGEGTARRGPEPPPAPSLLARLQRLIPGKRAQSRSKVNATADQSPDTQPTSTLWTDRPGAKKRIKQWRQQGEISPQEAEDLHFFCDNGYLVIPDALPDSLTTEILDDILAAWDNPSGQSFCSYWEGKDKFHEPSERVHATKPEAKLLDMHMLSERARAAIFNARLQRYLTLILEEEPLAFQSLSFERGSEQGMHSDVAFVQVDEPRSFVASWIALEDIQPGTGELEYYPGSQKIPDHLFDNGTVWADATISGYTPLIHKLAAGHGLTRQKFLPRKGDALIWTSGLFHGGSKITQPKTTRRSLVTHYCPAHCSPPYLKRAAKKFPSEHGGFICGQYTREKL